MPQADSVDTAKPSRRRFLLTAPLAAVATGKIAVECDVELRRLGLEFQHATELLDQAERQLEDLETLTAGTEPKEPAALRLRRTDNLKVDLDRGEGHERWYGARAIKALRSAPRTKREFTGTDADWNSLPGGENGPLKPHELAAWDRFYADVPDPVAQARADEIVAAWNRWQSDRARWRFSTGLAAAEDRVDDLDRQVVDLSERIRSAPVGGIAGLIVKAKVAAWCRGGHEIVDQATGRGDKVAFTIVSDLLAIGRA